MTEAEESFFEQTANSGLKHLHPLPTPDGEIGELDLPPMLYSEADQDNVPARLRPHLKAAADIARLREAGEAAQQWFAGYVADEPTAVTRKGTHETIAIIDAALATKETNP